MTFQEAGLDPQIVAPTADTVGASQQRGDRVEAGVGNALGPVGTANPAPEIAPA